jgi:hypothetical protein
MFLNLSKVMGGEDAMTLVTLSNRQNIIKQVVGMAGPGNTLTTTADVMGEHMLTMQGIALRNPNILAELTPTRKRLVS